MISFITAQTNLGFFCQAGWLAGWLLLYVGPCTPDCLQYSTRFSSPFNRALHEPSEIRAAFFFPPAP